MSIGAVALIWRPGRPPQSRQEAASWRPGTAAATEPGDHEFIPAVGWANSVPIRDLARVMVWVGRTPEGVAGLMRHELEHTVQIAAHRGVEHLHERAVEVLQERCGTGKSYNAIPMELDANRAAARFLRRRYGPDRLRQLVSDGDVDSACFRPTADPDGLDTLVARMNAFILNVMHDDDFVPRLESATRPG